MNKKTLSFPKVLLIASAVASVIAVIFRMILTSTVLDVHGLYERGNILPTVFHAFLAVFVIATVICAFKFTPIGRNEYTHPRTFASSVFSALAGAFFTLDALSNLYIIIVKKVEFNNFDLLELIFAIPCAVYFISEALQTKLPSAASALASLFPTAWCAVHLIRVYFDSELLMTDPGRILEQVALLAAMIAFLSESRAKLGIFSHKLFLAAASTAPVLLLASAVPDLIFHYKLMLSSSDSLTRTAVCAIAALFFYTRLAAYSSANTAENNFNDTERKQI